MKKIGLGLMLMAMIFSPAMLFAAKQKYDSKLTNSLVGEFLLQVEDRGKVWYVAPKDKKRYEIRFDNIVDMSAKLGFGIKHEDITKVPIKVVSLGQWDDTDQDDFYDRDEALRGFDPYMANTGKVKIDNKFAENQQGKVLLEVDGNGRLWYVDMESNRWSLEWHGIMAMLKELSIGITDANLNKIAMGEPLKSIKPDRYVNCRDSIDCMIASSSQCIRAGGYGDSSYFYEGNKIEMNVSIGYDIYSSGANNELCHLNVNGSNIYPELSKDYYNEVYSKLDSEGYEANQTINEILKYNDIGYGSMDETHSTCLYSKDVYVNLFKEFKNQGVQVFDAFFDIPNTGEHSCSNSMFYGYSNPGMANDYTRTFKGLSDIYVDSLKSNLSYYMEPRYVPLDEGVTDEYISDTNEIVDRNIERRSDISKILEESAKLCAAGTTTLNPVKSRIENTYFVNIDSVNSNLNIETDLTSILDPVDVGVCSSEVGGCEYTVMLDQNTKMFNTCNPYFLYKIENDDGVTHSLSCATNSQKKEGISNVNACK